MIDDLDKKLEEYKLEIEKAEKEEAERRRIAEEAERQHEEAEKELRRKKKFQQENDDFNSGCFYDNLGTYRHYLEQGHKPTYESCVHVKECKPRRYYSSDKLNKVAPVEVLKAAIEFGLSKDDATKLLSICLDEVLYIYIKDKEWLSKAVYNKEVQLSDRDIEEVRSKMKVLIEDGHADVSKFPISKIKELYCATHTLSTCVGYVPTGRRAYSSKHDAYYDEQEAIYHYETIEYKQPARDIFILLLQNGYKPETVADKKDFVYLYGPAKEHLEKLEQEKRKQQELIENFAKGVYYINLDEGLPVGKCRVPMSFSYDGNECSLLYLFKDTLGSKEKKLENLESIVEGNFGKDGFSGNITGSKDGISLKVQYKDGKMHGVYEEINSDGSVKKIQYKDGEMHGFYEEINSDGSVKKIQYKDGKMHGVYKELDPNGAVIVEKYYENEVDVTKKRETLKRIAGKKIKREEKLEGRKLPKAIKRIGKAGVKIDSKIQAAIAIRKAEKTE